MVSRQTLLAVPPSKHADHLAGPPFRFASWQETKIWDSLPISEQGGLPYRAAECQLYAQIQVPPCFTCFRLKWKFERYGSLVRV